eukprot:1648734-Pleurochrysis_carterae.AAC.2
MEGAGRLLPWQSVPGFQLAYLEMACASAKSLKRQLPAAYTIVFVADRVGNSGLPKMPSCVGEVFDAVCCPPYAARASI